MTGARQRRSRTKSRSGCYGEEPRHGEAGGVNSTREEAGQQAQSGDGDTSRDQGRDIDSVRRDLLRQSDWANLSLARPLKMRQLPGSSERDNLAKRRRLAGDDRRRLTAVRPGNARNREGGFARYDGVPNARRLGTERKASAASILDSDGISIRIGDPNKGRVRGVSDKPSSGCRTTQMLSQATEESMLFDGEEDDRQDFQTALADSHRGERRELCSTQSIQGQRDSEPLMSDAASSPVEEVNGREGAYYEQEEQDQLTMRSSPNSVHLPPLDPRGSFTTRDGQTRYNRPEMASNIAMGGNQGDTPTHPSTTITTSSPSKPIHPTQRRVPLWVSEEADTSARRIPDVWRHAPDQHNNNIDSAEAQHLESNGRCIPYRHDAADRRGFANEITRPTRPSNCVEDSESIWRRFIFG